MAKFCNKCQQTLEDSSFNKRADRPGLRAHCRKCCAKRPSRRKKPIMTPEQRKESQRLARKRYNETKERKAKQAAYEAHRRAAKLKATPKWLTETHLAHIAAYYECAAAISAYLGTQMDVDHIVPLKGKEVCGLHVPWNMQVMQHIGNVSKNNKLES